MPTLPWHEDGAGSAPAVVTVLVWLKSAAGMGWDGIIYKSETCLLWSSEILCALCFPAWGMGLSGASCAIVSLSLVPASSARAVLGAGTFPFLKPFCCCVIPGSFALPLPFSWRVQRKSALNLQLEAPSAHAGEAFLARVPGAARIHGVQQMCRSKSLRSSEHCIPLDTGQMPNLGFFGTALMST